MSHGLGHLRLSGPMIIDADTDLAFITVLTQNPNPVPQVRITAELEGGERYLLDFHVNPSKTMTFELEGPDGDEIEYQVGVNDEHLLLLVEPQQGGDCTFTLTAQIGPTASAFRFYAAEVSRLE